MRKILWVWLMLVAGAVWGASPIATTPYTRLFLRETNATAALARLGIADTNVGILSATGIADHMSTNAGVLQLKPGGTLPAMNAAALTNLTAATNTIAAITYRKANDVPSQQAVWDVPIAAVKMDWKILGQVFQTNAVETDTMRVSAFQKWNGKYRLFIGGGNGIGDSNYIVMAEGSSPYNMTRVGKALLGTAGEWDRGQVQGPFVMFENGTNYLYYFGGVESQWEVPPLDIGVAYATDAEGTNFVKYSGNPIVSHDSAAWNAQTMWSPTVIKHDNVYYLYCNAGNVASKETIGFYTATNPLGPFTEYAGNPVITNHANIVADPSIVKMKDGWLLACHGVDGTTLRQLFYQSTDLTNWTAIWTNASVVGVGYAGYDGQSPELFFDDGLKVLFDDGQRVWMAEPTNTWPYVGTFVGNGTSITNLAAGNIAAGTMTAVAVSNAPYATLSGSVVSSNVNGQVSSFVLLATNMPKTSQVFLPLYTATCKDGWFVRGDANVAWGGADAGSAMQFGTVIGAASIPTGLGYTTNLSYWTNYSPSVQIGASPFYWTNSGTGLVLMGLDDDIDQYRYTIKLDLLEGPLQ